MSNPYDFYEDYPTITSVSKRVPSYGTKKCNMSFWNFASDHPFPAVLITIVSIIGLLFLIGMIVFSLTAVSTVNKVVKSPEFQSAIEQGRENLQRQLTNRY